MDALPFDYGANDGVPMTDRGPMMFTPSGRPFWPLDPRPEEVFIDDIAHWLAGINRYNGGTRHLTYSVAQHSLLVWEHYTYVASRRPPSKASQLGALLHDGHEGPIGAEDPDHELLRWSDNAVLAAEIRDLIEPPQFEINGVGEPWQRKIEPITPQAAKYAFLAKFYDLTT